MPRFGAFAFGHRCPEPPPKLIQHFLRSVHTAARQALGRGGAVGGARAARGACGACGHGAPPLA
eukprot:5194957-Prymnesium_polylepis.1